MMNNGKILLLMDDLGGSRPDVFMEFDPTVSGSGAFTTVTAPNGPYVANWNDAEGPACWIFPTAQSSSRLRGCIVIPPTVSRLPRASPGITSITQNADGSFLLTGTNINGISEGGAFGDDSQMASTYPIVRLTSGSNAYYARTYNWSSTQVATGTTPETVDFALPLGLPAGTYSVVTVAVGNASAPVSLTIPTVPGDVAPTVAMRRGGRLAGTTTTGTTMSLTVLGASGNGESTLTYTWTNGFRAPSDERWRAPSFSVPTRATRRRTTTATFTAAGHLYL